MPDISPRLRILELIIDRKDFVVIQAVIVLAELPDMFTFHGHSLQQHRSEFGD
jgi:hypothetical protein